MLTMVAHSKAGGITAWDKPSVDKCLLNTECGPKGGLFTDFCNVVCRAGGFKSSTCTNSKGKGYAVCSCDGKGDAERFLKANCGFLCEIGCTSCGYSNSKCISEPKTAKSRIACSCSGKKI